MVLLHYRVVPGLEVGRPQPEPAAATPAPVELCGCEQATDPTAPEAA